MNNMPIMVAPVSTPLLAGCVHGFFGRGSSLDNPAFPDAAHANRAAAAGSVLPGAPIAINHQVHAVECRIIDAPFDTDARPHADALATRMPGLLLGVHTADCAPVLLCDAHAGVVGAAHAGWRGAIDGVTDSVIAAMEALGADRARIAAAIGPCIARTSYEVDGEFRARFIATDADTDRFFTDGPKGSPHFDLEAYVVHRLARAGIRQIAALGIDTYRSPLYWSHRRGTHSGLAERGRQIALIGLPRENAR